MDINPSDQEEMAARFSDVASAHMLLERAANIRASKVPMVDFERVSFRPGVLGAMAGYLCSNGLLCMAGNGLKELRARTHENLANKILEDS